MPDKTNSNLIPVIIMPVHITNENLLKLTILSLQYISIAIKTKNSHVTIYVTGYINAEYIDGYARHIDAISKSNLFLSIITSYRDRPYGFGENFNYSQSLINFEYDYILTINNDLLVPEFIFDSIEKSLNRADMVGIVSNYAMGVQLVDASNYGITNKSNILNITKYNDICKEYRKDNENEYENVPVLSFLCVAIKKTIIDDIGLLDEQFTIGTLEDVDFSLRAFKAGYKLVVCRECFCFHFGSQTFHARDIKVNEITALNRLKFNDKHGIKTIAEFNNILKLDALYQVYEHYKTNTESDIYQHLHKLKILANSVNHVTELGVRDGISTIAFLAGKPAVMRSYDINDWNGHATALTLINKSDTDFKFTQADDLTIVLEPTDLLFIDTLHDYDQLNQELALHAGIVKQYIVLHDVVTFDNKGETEGKAGLMPAVQEFLEANKQWEIKKLYTNNNGLLILQRRNLCNQCSNTFADCAVSNKIIFGIDVDDSAIGTDADMVYNCTGFVLQE